MTATIEAVRAAFGAASLGHVSLQETPHSVVVQVLKPALVTGEQQAFLDAHKATILPDGSEPARSTYYIPLGVVGDVVGSGVAPAGKAPQAAVA